MPLSAGTRLGPYEVIAAIGAGGMGEVYRARDSQLGRDVALKILPAAFAADPERLARFEREAKTLASLNHPNIASIYAIESTPDGRALVMELVEGRTLDAHIRERFELRTSHFEVIEWALPIARAIADALETAHESGIVHRDLKPANVMVRADGAVKVLDFGLAKAAAPDAGPSDLANSPTLTAQTHAGMILGTAAYMAPEQARGKVVDKRADVWAFGCVLFECLTGTRAFGGDEVSDVLAAVLRQDVDWSALPATTPARVRELLARCLDRDLRTRLRDIGEARVALDRANVPVLAGSMSHQASESRSLSPLRLAALAAAGLALATLAAFVGWNARPPAQDIPVRRLDLAGDIAGATRFAVSPDGNRVAYFLHGHLYVRSLATGTTTDLGTISPASTGIFWSADSARIAYGTESSLRVVPAEGGPPFTICKVPGSGSILDGVWREDGIIFFAVWRDSAYRVAATGGTPVVQVALDRDKEIDFHSIDALPGDRLVVTSHQRGKDAVHLELVELGGGSRRTVLTDDPDIDQVRFRPPNHLLFERVRNNPGTWIVPFEGGPVDITRATLIEAGAGPFDVSREGTLVTSIPPVERRDLIWATPETPVKGSLTTSSRASVPGAAYESLTSSVALSPDGRRAVVAVRAADNREEFLVRDLATGADTRIQFPQAPTGMRTGSLVTWTPGGRLLYGSGGVESLQIYDWPADGSGNGRPLVAGMAARMTPDGRYILFISDERQGKRTLYRAPILPDGSAGQIERVFGGTDEPTVRWFDISPDGKLLAFTTSDATTEMLNVVLATYPDLKQRQQVTSTGGSEPRFSRDSRRLFYLVGRRTPGTALTVGELRVVPITNAPLGIGASTLAVTEGTSGSGAPTLSGFDVAADGRILMTRVAPTAPGEEARLVLWQNWPAAIRK